MIDADAHEEVLRKQIRQRVGKEIFVYMKLPEGGFQRMRILDMQGSASLVLFVEHDPRRPVW
jgi:hypothetical protein